MGMTQRGVLTTRLVGHREQVNKTLVTQEEGKQALLQDQQVNSIWITISFILPFLRHLMVASKTPCYSTIYGNCFDIPGRLVRNTLFQARDVLPGPEVSPINPTGSNKSPLVALRLHGLTLANRAKTH